MSASMTWASIPTGSATAGSLSSASSAMTTRAAPTRWPRCSRRAAGSCQSMSGLAPQNGSVTRRADRLSRSPAARTAWRKNPRISS